jgi:hypothetical protein
VVDELAWRPRATYKRVIKALENDGVKLDSNSRSIIKAVFVEKESEVVE